MQAPMGLHVSLGLQLPMSAECIGNSQQPIQVCRRRYALYWLNCSLYTTNGMLQTGLSQSFPDQFVCKRAKGAEEKTPDLQVVDLHTLINETIFLPYHPSRAERQSLKPAMPDVKKAKPVDIHIMRGEAKCFNCSHFQGTLQGTVRCKDGFNIPGECNETGYGYKTVCKGNDSFK
ncbi:hypothetical protein AVEN_237161-1 [Araneus ventricosus]|uniref:Uncharacterized protein n=1 Tax=Araneus ventricosus TaxID=182803 RepID=A0A4Y2LBN5_ARAVE|nr:hypothetical protein AVEN_237161-1 [Araneus ventricosus]